MKKVLKVLLLCLAMVGCDGEQQVYHEAPLVRVIKTTPPDAGVDGEAKQRATEMKSNYKELLGDGGSHEDSKELLEYPAEGEIDKKVIPLRGGDEKGNFKVPLLPGYHWEVTQSWKEHCEFCEKKYGSTYGTPYCVSHHKPCCEYGWDFNLPNDKDVKKDVLASADGYVKSVKTGYNGGWGNSVVIDHGNDICTRYSHLYDNSIKVVKGQKVCQGLRLGGIGNTGNSDGAHLHFQFESCKSGKGIKMGFTDGNGIPVCTRMEHVKTNGKYNFLKLTNVPKDSCGGVDTSPLPEGGWKSVACGSTVKGCPLDSGCKADFGHTFKDQSLMDSWTAEAVDYLYAQCAVNGKQDGKLHPDDHVSRAEALKVPLLLFGHLKSCGVTLPMKPDNWVTPVVGCAVQKGIIKGVDIILAPSLEADFGEAATYMVKAAVKAGVISIKTPFVGHFSKISKEDSSYAYVETVHNYGGITKGLLSKASGDSLKRKDYMKMVAALSPCFSRSVKCDSGCDYEKDKFKCSGPGMPAPKPDEPNKCMPNCFNQECGNDGCGGSCGVCASPTECVSGQCKEKENDYVLHCYIDAEKSKCDDNGDPKLKVKCTMDNNSGETLMLENLVMEMTSSEDEKVCVVSNAKMKDGGVTYYKISPGKNQKLSGSFAITCDQAPADSKISLSFDMIEKVKKADDIVHADLFKVEIDVPSKPFEACQKCAPKCAGKECGNDGCGGSCGGCKANYQCVGGKCYEIPGAFPDPPKPEMPCFPSCLGKQCGSNGCGGSCGFCGKSQYCSNGKCKKAKLIGPVKPPEVGCSKCPKNSECIKGLCDFGTWKCDPYKGYQVKLRYVKQLTLGHIDKMPVISHGSDQHGKWVLLKFPCANLPSQFQFAGSEWTWLETDEVMPPMGFQWFKTKPVTKSLLPKEGHKLKIPKFLAPSIMTVWVPSKKWMQ